MPIFEYLCQDCGKEFEAFVTGERKPSCPACHGAHLGKLLSAPGMVGAGERSAGSSPQPSFGGCGAGGGGCACRATAH